MGRGLNFGNGEVLGTLIVHKRINANLSLSDTCESVIISSFSIFSVDF